MSDSVPGSNDGELQIGEHVGEVQPNAPVGVPATAKPSTDQVTVNTHLRKVVSELESVSKYVETFLGDKKVIKALEDTISVVASQVK